MCGSHTQGSRTQITHTHTHTHTQWCNMEEELASCGVLSSYFLLLKLCLILIVFHHLLQCTPLCHLIIHQSLSPLPSTSYSQNSPILINSPSKVSLGAESNDCVWLLYVCVCNAHKLVVCLSTNGERTLNYTIVKQLILTTKTQATKIKSNFYITYIR